MNRRNLLKAGLTLAGGTLLASGASAGRLKEQMPNSDLAIGLGPGHRKLGGQLEVSSIGLGVQNMQ